MDIENKLIAQKDVFSTEQLIRQAKRDIRRQIKAKLNLRKNISGLNESDSKKACSLLSDSEIYKKANIILAYMPMPEEVDIMPVIKNALILGKYVAVPRIINGTNDMDFYLLKNAKSGREIGKDFENQFDRGIFGIREPKECLKKLSLSDIRKASYDTGCLVLVPALAFERSGARLGRGKGFYDKFLSALKGSPVISCGVCFNFQILDSVPTETNDFAVDYILSEMSLQNTKRIFAAI